MSNYKSKILKNIIAFLLVVVAISLTVYGHLKYSWNGLIIQVCGLSLLLVLVGIYNWKNK